MKITIECGKTNSEMQALVREIAWALKAKDIEVRNTDGMNLNPENGPVLHSQCLKSISKDPPVEIEAKYKHFNGV